MTDLSHITPPIPDPPTVKGVLLAYEQELLKEVRGLRRASKSSDMDRIDEMYHCYLEARWLARVGKEHDGQRRFKQVSAYQPQDEWEERMKEATLAILKKMGTDIKNLNIA